MRVPIKCSHHHVECQSNMTVTCVVMLRAGRPDSEGDLGEEGPSRTHM